MEHSRFSLLKLLFGVILLFSIGGCRSEDPNPEVRDPLYKAIKDELAGAEKGLEDAKKAKEEAYKRMNETEPRTIDKRNAEKEYWKAVKQVDSLTTAVAYLKIRVERRRVETRAAYRKAFKAHKEEEWPNPSEYSGYLTNRRLREVNLNWSRRVPKLKDRLPSSQGEAKPAKKAENSEGGGEE
ncbi:MAG TPA: hypothetical protein DCL41_08160 [Bdellovibrionales bacterium]|nr:hypothetical protein [Pseudobdellovibrionaceae bacterium]HAG91830.1 hypothetical protein [Bdellovibrionales bacterium]